MNLYKINDEYVIANSMNLAVTSYFMNGFDSKEADEIITIQLEVPVSNDHNHLKLFQIYETESTIHPRYSVANTFDEAAELCKRTRVYKIKILSSSKKTIDNKNYIFV